MPAKRLPWFKLWPEAIEHEKVAQLSDGVFRTWVTALAKAADQPTRWRFASRRHAAAVTGRPTSHIQALVNFRLLDDQGADGLWIHDWQQWQERYPSDFDSTPPSPDDHPPEHSANGAAKPPPTLRDRSDKKREERSKNVEIEKDEEKTTAAAPTFSIGEQERIDEVTAVLSPFGITSDPLTWRTVLDEYGDLNLQAEALKQADWLRRNRKKICSSARYLEWLTRAQSGSQRPGRPGPLPRLAIVSKPEPEDSTPGPMCRRCGQHEQDPRPTSNSDLAGLCGLCAIMTRQELRGLRPVG